MTQSGTSLGNHTILCVFFSRRDTFLPSVLGAVCALSL